MISWVLASSPLLWSLAGACGVLVHNEVFHRSSHLFSLPTSNADISSYQALISPLLSSPAYAPSVQAGAFFPDWGYQCIGTNDDAEAAHWPPFLIAAVEHIISHYGYLNSTRPPKASWSAEEQAHLESLISFVFAIASHQAADATWHAIRLPTALLAALSGADFDGDTNAAHRVLDFGGDVVFATRIARMGDAGKEWISDEWAVPLDDLVGIYARMGRDVSKFVVRYCTMRGLAALRSGLAVGPSLYDAFASQSPMLTGALDDYYLGGVDEMAARTVSCWANLTKWFAYGVDKEEKLRDGWGICDVFWAIRARGGAGNSLHGAGSSHGLWGATEEFSERAEQEMKRIKVRTDKFGAEVYSLPPLPPREKPSPPPPPPPPPPPSKQRLSASDAPKLQKPTYLATYVPYAHFGASLSAGNFSPAGPAIAVGAPWESSDSSKPGEGTIYVLPLSDISLGATTTAAAGGDLFKLQRQTSASTDQRFGISSSPWRVLNTTFLAVGAPGPLSYDGSTPPSLPFLGSVPAGRVDVFRPGSATRSLTISVAGAELGSIGRRWWAESVFAADLAGTGEEYLIISGSRSDGLRICEGRGKTQYGEGEIAVVSLSNANPTSGGAQDQDIEIDARIVNIPGEVKADVPCGKTDTYEYFGASLAFAAKQRTLLVGAPGAGRVFGFQLAEGGSLNHTMTIARPRSPLSSSSPSALRTGFGGGGLLAGVSPQGKEWVAVSSPDEDSGENKQAGVLRIYTLASPEARLVAVVTAEPAGAEFGRFGKVLAKDGKEGGVWVASGHWDGERGALWWVDVGAIVDGSGRGISAGQAVLADGKEGEVKSYVAEPVTIGEEINAKFGSSLAVGPAGELVVGIPYSGVTRPKQEERFYGAVAVFRREI